MEGHIVGMVLPFAAPYQLRRSFARIAPRPVFYQPARALLERQERASFASTWDRRRSANPFWSGSAGFSPTRPLAMPMALPRQGQQSAVALAVRFSAPKISRTSKSLLSVYRSCARGAAIRVRQWSLPGLPRPKSVRPGIYSPITYIECAGRPEAISRLHPSKGSRLSSLWTGAVGTTVRWHNLFTYKDLAPALDLAQIRCGLAFRFSVA